MNVGTRTYLSSDQRRRQLLDAAGRLFVTRGLSGMTMVAVAREAGASRQLVYDHFADLAALQESFFEERAADYLGQLDRAIDSPGGGDPVVAAFTTLLSIPAEDRQAIRLLAADTSTTELDGIRRRLRERLETRWMERLDGLGGDERLARAVLWTSMGTVLTVADLADRKEITRAQAIELATAAVHALAGAAGRHRMAVTADPARGARG